MEICPAIPIVSGRSKSQLTSFFDSYYYYGTKKVKIISHTKTKEGKLPAILKEGSYRKYSLKMTALKIASLATLIAPLIGFLFLIKNYFEYKKIALILPQKGPFPQQCPIPSPYRLHPYTLTYPRRLNVREPARKLLAPDQLKPREVPSLFNLTFNTAIRTNDKLLLAPTTELAEKFLAHAIDHELTLSEKHFDSLGKANAVHLSKLPTTNSLLWKAPNALKKAGVRSLFIDSKEIALFNSATRKEKIDAIRNLTHLLQMASRNPFFLSFPDVPKELFFSLSPLTQDLFLEKGRIRGEAIYRGPHATQEEQQAGLRGWNYPYSMTLDRDDVSSLSCFLRYLAPQNARTQFLKLGALNRFLREKDAQNSNQQPDLPLQLSNNLPELREIICHPSIKAHRILDALKAKSPTSQEIFNALQHLELNQDTENFYPAIDTIGQLVAEFASLKELTLLLNHLDANFPNQRALLLALADGAKLARDSKKISLIASFTSYLLNNVSS